MPGAAWYVPIATALTRLVTMREHPRSTHLPSCTRPDAAYGVNVDQELAAVEISVCPLCGTHVQPSEGPAVVAVEEWAADGLLPALAVMSCPNPHCPPEAR